MSVIERIKDLWAGSRFHPDSSESVRFLEGKGSEADLPEPPEAPGTFSDLDEPASENKRIPYDDGS